MELFVGVVQLANKNSQKLFFNGILVNKAHTSHKTLFNCHMNSLHMFTLFLFLALRNMKTKAEKQMKVPSGLGDIIVIEISFFVSEVGELKRGLGGVSGFSSANHTCFGGGALSLGFCWVGDTGTDFGTLLLCIRDFGSENIERIHLQMYWDNFSHVFCIF